MSLVATVSPNRQTIHLQGQRWAWDMPADRLPIMVKLYRDLEARAGGRFARFYTEDRKTLEAVQREIVAK